MFTFDNTLLVWMIEFETTEFKISVPSPTETYGPTTELTILAPFAMQHGSIICELIISASFEISMGPLGLSDGHRAERPSEEGGLSCGCGWEFWVLGLR